MNILAQPILAAGDALSVLFALAMMALAALGSMAQKRSEKRLLTATEIEAALDIADDAPNPAQAAETKSELDAIDRALVDLPARQRAIFLALWKGHQPPAEIAKRFGLSTRKVYLELKAAREHCMDSLAKAAKSDFKKK